MVGTKTFDSRIGFKTRENDVIPFAIPNGTTLSNRARLEGY